MNMLIHLIRFVNMTYIQIVRISGSCESETIEFVLETYFVLNHQRIHQRIYVIPFCTTALHNALGNRIWHGN